MSSETTSRRTITTIITVVIGMLGLIIGGFFTLRAANIETAYQATGTVLASEGTQSIATQTAIGQTLAAPSDTLQPTFTQQPTFTPLPTYTSLPEVIIVVTATLQPTSTSTPIPPSATPTQTPTITPTFTPLPFEIRTVALVSTTRIDNDDAEVILSVEFTGGEPPYTLIGDFFDTMQVEEVSGTFVEGDTTYKFIRFQMKMRCYATVPFMITIQDSSGQAADYKDLLPQILC